MTNRLTLFFLIVFFLMQSTFLLQEAGAAEAKGLHTWTDEKGVVHISDTANDRSKKTTLTQKNTPRPAILWTIALALPILIRFVFLRHPLPKTGALIALVFIWLINSAVFRALNIESKANMILLLLSYIILCKGYARYKRVQAGKKGFRRAKEKAKVEKEHEEEKGGPGNKRQGVKSVKHYEDTLELDGSYTAEDIKRCYKELVQKYHPDKVNHLGDRLKETAEMEIKNINEAYEYFKKKKGFK